MLSPYVMPLNTVNQIQLAAFSVRNAFYYGKSDSA